MSSWYCIYTKPRQEDLVSKRLQELNSIEIFNPKIRRKKYIRTRLLEVTEELFPAYIFAKFDESNIRYFHLIKYTRGVKRLIGDHKGNPYIVEKSIIECIQSRMENGFVRLASPKMARGEEVYIKEGPFCGLTGLFLEELKPKDRVLILLNSIQYQARLVTTSDCITKVT